MRDGEPKNLGDIQRIEPLNATEQFLTMRPSEFRDFLDDYWRKNKDAKVAIEIEEGKLTEDQRIFLSRLEQDWRIGVDIKHE